MTYAAPAWSFISKTKMKCLQVVQNRTLRLILGYDRYTRSEQLHSDNEILRFEDMHHSFRLKLRVFAFPKSSHVPKISQGRAMVRPRYPIQDFLKI